MCSSKPASEARGAINTLRIRSDSDRQDVAAAALAFPGRQVISVNGDGAFGINAMEIDTAVRHDAKAVSEYGREDYIKRIKLLYFLSTPTEGSQLSGVFGLVSQNPQFRDMAPADRANKLGEEIRRWLASHCACFVKILGLQKRGEQWTWFRLKNT